MRVIVADCSAEYSGRLSASLPPAKRVLLIKADNSLLIFSELGSYKPLNWMAAPCTLKDVTPDSVEAADGPTPEHILRVCADKTSDVLEVSLYHVYSDTTYDLGIDPGLIKDGVEDHLQRYLSEQIDRIGPGSKLIRREYPTAIGPVDIMASTPTASTSPSRSNATAASTASSSSPATASSSTATPSSPPSTASSPPRPSPLRPASSPRTAVSNASSSIMTR